MSPRNAAVRATQAPPPTQGDPSRTSQYQQATRDSISLHGGPWGGCDTCHHLEETLLNSITAPDEQWLRTIEAWYRHLALS